jgi:DNA modification methylase
MQLYNGDCSTVMVGTIDSETIDLTITSPPYDDLRTYEGFHFNIDLIVQQLYRVTKPGGIVVWVIGDSVVNGSETLTSFSHALRFKDKGFRLHDTMIWEKANFSNPSSNRYHQIFEYMFVFSKGKPKTFNPILDVKNKWGTCWGKNTHRQKDGSLVEQRKPKAREYGMRKNIWRMNTVGQDMMNKGKPPHPAMFPEQLVKDHITTWSNKGDTVLDPFMGSGTTGRVAKEMNRNFIGIEISKSYFDIATSRINDILQPLY